MVYEEKKNKISVWAMVFMLPFKYKGSITCRRTKESYFPISVHLVVGLAGV